MLSEISTAFSTETQRFTNLYIKRIKLMLQNDTVSKKIKRTESNLRAIEQKLQRQKEAQDFTEPEV